MTDIIHEPETGYEKEHLCAKLKEFFESEEGVELAYLFGSAANGKMGVLSDIDIGVYLSGEMQKSGRNQKRLELIGKLTTALSNNRIDLVIMNDTPPTLNFEIIKPIVPVFVKDEDMKVDVEQRIMSRYLDWKYHEDSLNRAFLKRVMERGLS